MDHRQDEDDSKLPPVGSPVAGVGAIEDQQEEEARTEEALQPIQQERPPTQIKPARKMKKSPHAPKRFKSSYIFFSTEKHKEIRQRLDGLGIQEKTSNVAKMVSEAWHNLSPDEREVYEDMSRKDKARYKVEKTMYKGDWIVPIGYKRPKDATAPKRPNPAFFAFSNKRRAITKAQIPGASNAQVSKALSQMWKEAPDVLREQYKHEEAKLVRKYKVDIAEWRRKENETMKRRQESAMRIAESDGGDAAHDHAARSDVLEQYSNAVPGAHNLPVFQTQYHPLLMNRQQGNSSPRLLHHAPVSALAVHQQTNTTPYYHQGAVDAPGALNQQQLSLLANSASTSAAVASAADHQQRRMMVVAGNQIDSTVLGPYAGNTAISFRSNRPRIQEHQTRLLELIAAARREQNQHPRHQYNYHQHHHAHQTMRRLTDLSFRVGGASSGSMLPNDHQYYHAAAGGQAASSTFTVNPLSVPAAASSSLEEGTLVDAYNNTNQNVAVPAQQYTEAQLLVLLQQQGMFEEQQQEEVEQQQQQQQGRSAVLLNGYQQQQKGSFLGLRGTHRTDAVGDTHRAVFRSTAANVGTRMDPADDTHIGVFVSTAVTVGGGASNSAIFLAPNDAHRGTVEGAFSLDPGAAEEGAYKTDDPPGGVAAPRTMIADDGYHRQSTTINDHHADAADGFNRSAAAFLSDGAADGQEMHSQTNTAADRQQGSSLPSSAGFLDRGDWLSGLRRGGGEGGQSSYFESMGSSLSSIDETDLP